jgi:DNA-binding transcriptional LysR family regulator
VTYDQLSAFLRVATEGSFTAASATLHKSQPAVSKLVRNLEDELGFELFDRAAYRATLTDAGRLFLERAAGVIEDTEALRRFGLELAGEIEPVVRLAVDAIAPLAPILEVLSETRSRFPAVHVELRTERLSGAIQALRENAVDLAIGTRVGVDVRTMEIRRFGTVRVVAVASADHPLSNVRGPVPGHLLRQHAQIVLRDSGAGGASASFNVLSGGLSWTVTDVAAKKQIIAAGMGWGGLPERMVAAELARGSLALLDVPEFEADALDLFTVRRRDRPRGVVGETLWRTLARPLPPDSRRRADEPRRLAECSSTRTSCRPRATGSGSVSS